MPTADEILGVLDPEQREVAANPLGPMCVLAGAGTGKTRAITHRVAYGVASGAYPAQRVLAVTFTARAAGEMRTRLRVLGVPGVAARTFHAAALRQLTYFWPAAVGGAAPRVLPHKAPVVGQAAAQLRLDVDRTAVRDLAAEIEWSKVNLLTADTYAEAARRAGREPAGLDPTAMARLIRGYEEAKTEQGAIDFEDVLLVTSAILSERDDIAATVRDQYRHLVVDEYQDVNLVQQRLLDLWAGQRQDVCVVGDPEQTIYTFTGASPDHLLSFVTRYPQARTVRLIRNYRSTRQIVGLANAIVVGGRLQAQVGEPGPEPTLTDFPDDVAEAAGVADRIAGMVAAGRDPATIAVLFRTNAQSEGFEAALAQAGVPYLVRGGERFFARREVRDAIVLLRAQVRSDDGSRPLPDLVREIVAATGWSPQPPSRAGAMRERWESITALVGLAEELVAAVPHARLGDLVAELDERAASQHAPQVNGVTLASFHAAKGLEWEVVFLAGCSDGLIPISLAQTPAATAEERRLLYVGITRARAELHLSWSRARTPGGSANRRPSRFLESAAGILGEQVRPQTSAGRREPRRRRTAVVWHCSGCGVELTTAAHRKTGRCDNCPPTYDEAVFESLRAWRSAVARQAKVPAYVVFTDATLTVIAERVPADVGQLSQVPGVGARKLSSYGPAVLAVLSGEDPAVVAGMPDE